MRWKKEASKLTRKENSPELLTYAESGHELKIYRGIDAEMLAKINACYYESIAAAAARPSGKGRVVTVGHPAEKEMVTAILYSFDSDRPEANTWIAVTCKDKETVLLFLCSLGDENLRAGNHEEAAKEDSSALCSPTGESHPVSTTQTKGWEMRKWYLIALATASLCIFLISVFPPRIALGSAAARAPRGFIFSSGFQEAEVEFSQGTSSLSPVVIDYKLLVVEILAALGAVSAGSFIVFSAMRKKG